jgi:hypothetical protein
VKSILILEDNDERIAGFQKAMAEIGGGFELKIWRDAHSMIAECAEFFPTAWVICLDHDLNPQPGATTDPGTGLDVAPFLADFLPVCPVLIHSSNTDRVYSMHNEFRFAGWVVDRVGPLAANAFGGQGSMGNGGAMRVAPLGAYFADDLERCAEAARASSQVTHTHPEGVAGTVAVAVGAAMAWRLRDGIGAEFAPSFFGEILRLTPESKVRRGITLASQTPGDVPLIDVAKALGNGSLVTAPDTVPFCIWMAAHHPGHFVEAIGKTISAGGDCDTNAAIVGGMVALSAGRASIPSEWLKAREKIQL